jgi:hypothetical protein
VRRTAIGKKTYKKEKSIRLIIQSTWGIGAVDVLHDYSRAVHVGPPFLGGGGGIKNPLLAGYHVGTRLRAEVSLIAPLFLRGGIKNPLLV